MLFPARQRARISLAEISMAGIATMCRTRPGAASGAPEASSGLVRHVVAIPAIEISASEIRARCLAGKSIRYLVPDAVAEYIERKGLYR